MIINIKLILIKATFEQQILVDGSEKSQLEKISKIPQILNIFDRFLDYLKEKKYFRSCFNVLTHNDVLHGNILWDLNNLKYLLIDFEYGGLNIIGINFLQTINNILIILILVYNWMIS